MDGWRAGVGGIESVTHSIHGPKPLPPQAPPELLAALEAGQPLRLVGGGREQSAALVTGDATYELCRVETSNMLLLVPSLPAGTQEGAAVGNASFHYEVG